MEIFGIGASELVFILIIAIIVLGPKDMQKTGRMIGRFLNQLVHSDSWKVFQRTSTELRNLPRNLMREANMEMADLDKEVRNTIDPRTTPEARPPVPPPPSSEPPTIQSNENVSEKNE
jgi:sec-independent protein translocase protein TatB